MSELGEQTDREVWRAPHLVDGVAERYDSETRVDPEPGAGATFSFSLRTASDGDA